jgi:hypothetical protein
MDVKTKTSETQKNTDNSRRRFLKSAAKVAVYTPPAMLAMSKPSFAHFNKSSGATYETSWSDGYDQSFWDKCTSYFGW